MKKNENETSQPTPHLLDLPELPPRDGQGDNLLTSPLNAIEHVKVKLTVRIGEAEISIGELNHMKEDHVLRLDNLVDEPVDILLEGRVVARGQLVAVDDNFGVRITELPRIQ